jgi:NADH-quinone oxidoreductase subunit E
MENDYSGFLPVLEKYKNIAGSLITVLQEAQDMYGWLPAGLIELISGETGIKPAKIMGVVTFYTQFRTKRPGRHMILLCQGTACHVNGSAALYDALSLEFGVSDGETTEDGLFTLANVACLGCCSLSPAMMIDGETFGNLTPERACEIVRRVRE